VVHAETCNSTAQHGEQPARACRLREGEAATVRRVKSTGGPLLGDRPPDYRCCIRGRHIGIASLAPTVRSGTGAARTAPSTVPASFGGGEAVRLPLVGSPNSTRRSHPCNTTAMHKSSMRTRRPGPSTVSISRSSPTSSIFSTKVYLDDFPAHQSLSPPLEVFGMDTFGCFTSRGRVLFSLRSLKADTTLLALVRHAGGVIGFGNVRSVRCVLNLLHLLLCRESLLTSTNQQTKGRCQCLAY
jgi:hypothetical protein